MSIDPDIFHVTASLRAGDLSAAIRLLLELSRTAPGIPELVDWRDADHCVHDVAEAVPGDLRGIGLTFAEDSAFGVLEHNADGTLSLGLQHVVAGLSEDAQRAVLDGWAEVCRMLLRQGVLSGARLTRQAGGKCVPFVPLAGYATHLVVCSAEEIAEAFSDAAAFTRAWDSVEAYDGMRLCLRGMSALRNPSFLVHILPGQMAMARAARPGLTRFYAPQFEPGELAILEAGDPTLTGVGYYAGEQIYEFAGHTPKGTELRCIDLLMARRIVSAGQIEGGGPVREVRAVFMDEEQASRSAKLLQEAGVVICWEDDQGQLRRVPSLIASPQTR